jgi:hypothetical protein
MYVICYPTTMRLINTKTLELHEFEQSQTLRYAILSYIWENEEVTFTDMCSPHRPSKNGYAKVTQTGHLADQRDGLEYVWVDTCCTMQTHELRRCPMRTAACTAENDGSSRSTLNTI